MAREKLEKRFKIFSIDQQLILGMIKGLYDKEVVNLPDFSGCLPEDAQVFTVHYNYERLVFDFLIYSKTFEIVPEGTMIPRIDKMNCRMRIIKLPKEQR